MLLIQSSLEFKCRLGVSNLILFLFSVSWGFFCSTSWQVYRRRASEISTALREVIDDFEVTVNASKPRRGSFELTLIDEGRGSWVALELHNNCDLKCRSVMTRSWSVQKIHKYTYTMPIVDSSKSDIIWFWLFYFWIWEFSRLLLIFCD